MTTFNIDTVCRTISNTYSSFEGRSIAPGCANVRIFDTIMRMVDYMQSNKAVRSCSFTVTPNDGSGKAKLLTIVYHGGSVHSARAFSLVESDN